MDIKKRFHDFDLPVNPYDFLGVKRGCKDLKTITRAYHRKSLSLHPDKRKGQDFDFSTLNKCFVYLKTLVNELNNVNTENVHQRLLSMQKSRKNNNDNFHGNTASHETFIETPIQEPVQSTEVDFRKQFKHDNCIIGIDEFDEDTVLQNMMRHRPTSTSYKDIELSFRNPYQGNSFSNYEQSLNNYHDETTMLVDGFSSFDELGSITTPVVSDGNFMFVDGTNTTKKGTDVSRTFTGTSYGYLDQFTDYDRNLELQRDTISNTNEMVSETDMKRLRNVLDKCNTVKQKKLTKTQFSEQLNEMEARHHESLRQQQINSQKRVNEQVSRLTDMTKSRLYSDLKRLANC